MKPPGPFVFNECTEARKGAHVVTSAAPHERPGALGRDPSGAGAPQPHRAGLARRGSGTAGRAIL